MNLKYGIDYKKTQLKNEGKFSEDLGKDQGWGYTTWQSTTFCISASKALNGRIKYPFNFLDKWKNPDPDYRKLYISYLV